MEKKLLILSFIVAIIGIMLLATLLNKIESKNMEIDEINSINTETSERIKIFGTAKTLIVTENVTIIEISQESTINAVIFDRLSDITNETEIEAIGTIEERDGKRQLIVSRIRVVR